MTCQRQHNNVSLVVAKVSQAGRGVMFWLSKETEVSSPLP